METERIALSQRERDRLRVLHEVKQKQITQIAAAKRLKISDRHIRRLLFRLGEHGDRAVIHGLRGRRSNRRLAARLELKILRRVRQRYADFGPTLAAEHLAQEGLSVSRETLRKWMVKTSLWCPRAQRVKTIHVWRERRASFGELVMQDSSPFGWLEERGPACQLIAVIDDATSRFYARFTEHDTTEENLRTFGEWVRRYGRPLAHYTDKNSIFRTSAAAHSPQAKGRIERLFETLQDRLVKEMRLAGIDNIAAANHFLEMRFLPAWEERFTVAPRRPRNAHRRLHREQRLEEILSVRVARKVADDHTVSWDGTHWGVPREEVCAGLRGCAGGNRTASGWLALATFPRPLPAPAPLPSTPATVRKSFRPTASRTCGTNTETQKQNQTQIPCACTSPLEETMEPDISILRKTGHFYFALTRIGAFRRCGEPV